MSNGERKNKTKAIKIECGMYHMGVLARIFCVLEKDRNITRNNNWMCRKKQNKKQKNQKYVNDVRKRRQERLEFIKNRIMNKFGGSLVLFKEFIWWPKTTFQFNHPVKSVIREMRTQKINFGYLYYKAVSIRIAKENFRGHVTRKYKDKTRFSF